MRHFPLYIDLEQQKVALAGGGEAALAKLRLLMKTPAQITVFSPSPAQEIINWAEGGKLALQHRDLTQGDLADVRLVYAATENAQEDQRIRTLVAGTAPLLNVVDNLEASDFITPAIVDRAPLTVAIGTEGTAPVLARAVKKDIEDRLSPALGPLARIANGFRSKVLALAPGAARRSFWQAYFQDVGPKALNAAGEDGATEALERLLGDHLAARPGRGHVSFVGAGPGDPELLTHKARQALDRADVVIYDRLVAPEILELARREAKLIEAGKTGFGPSTDQKTINALITEHGAQGMDVVRLKSGDPTVFGRLDEEIEACDEVGIVWSIVPGITAASAAVASLGQSLTKRGRNGDLRLLTGHDVEGFAEQDWRHLARPGAVAAVYMGKRAARFFAGRLLMHGATRSTPVSIVENASRPSQRILSSTIETLAADIKNAGLEGPAVIVLGLPPRMAPVAVQRLNEEYA